VGWDEGPGLVASVWRFRWLVAAVALAGALAGAGASTLQPVMYEATSQILLAPPPAGDGGQVEADRYVRNQAAFLTSPPVLERAVRLVKGRVTVKQLRKRLVAEPSKESDLVTVRVRDASAQGAVDLAAAVGQAYEQTAVEHDRAGTNRTVGQLQADQKALDARLRELDAGRRASPGNVALQPQRDEVARQLTEVTRRIEQARLAGTGRDPVALREQAVLPEQPAQPQPSRMAALGGLLGAMLAAGLAWKLAWRRRAAAGPLQPEWVPPAGLAAAKPVGRRERLARALRSRLPHRSGGGEEAWPAEAAPTPDVGSARARARMVTVMRSRLVEDDAGDVTVALAEEPEHNNGKGHHPSANGNGNGRWAELHGDEPDGNQSAASE
jgi:LPS O-antigen subunit length determinant protein (WzzB/FepE family)